MEDGGEFPYDIRLFNNSLIGCGHKAIWFAKEDSFDLKSNFSDLCKRNGAPIICSRKLVQW